MVPPRQASRFRPNPATVARRIDDEVVLVHLTTNQMYVLNRTAARLWDLVCAGHGRADIVRTIGEEFEVDEAALGDEVEEVLASMTRDELITPCDRS